MSITGTCGSDGCTGSTKFSLPAGPVGFSYDPVTNTAGTSASSPGGSLDINSNGQGVLFVGPTLKPFEQLGGRIGSEIKATFDEEAFMRNVFREIERQRIDYRFMPANVRDFIDENVKVKLSDGETYGASELHFNHQIR